MHRKLLIRIFLVLALLSVFLYFLWRQPSRGSGDGTNISLSFNLCLSATNGAAVIDQDNLPKLAYLRNAWIDSTRQFYAKTIQLAPEDTIYVSVWNQIRMQEVERILLRHGGDPLASYKGETDDGIPYSQSFNRRDSLYYARYLVRDQRFQTLVLLDRYGPDSAAVRRFYEADRLLNQIQLCL